jgi:hypothetical protein
MLQTELRNSENRYRSKYFVLMSIHCQVFISLNSLLFPTKLCHL